MTGVWNTVIAATPHLVAAGGGSIVLISYSKFALRGMAKSFAAKLAHHHIRINSVQAVPGGAIGGEWRLGRMFTNLLQVEGVQPEDVADTVLFLASDESKYVTAHEISPGHRCHGY